MARYPHGHVRQSWAATVLTSAHVAARIDKDENVVIPIPNLQAYVACYVVQLAGPDGEDAWHSPVEAGPAALPHLAEALEAAADPHLRASLVRVAAEYRSTDAVPLLKSVLEDRGAEVGKCALDGLVVLGGPVAVDALVSAKAIAMPERREWIDEAIRQVLDAR